MKDIYQQVFNSHAIIQSSTAFYQNYVNCANACQYDVQNNVIKGEEFFTQTQQPSLSVKVAEKIMFGELQQIKMKLKSFVGYQLRLRVVSKSGQEKISGYHAVTEDKLRDQFVFDFCKVGETLCHSGMPDVVDKIILEVKDINTFKLQELYGSQNSYANSLFQRKYAVNV